MAKLTLSSISSFGPSILATINANWDAIEAALENTLSRDGTTPNTMSADLDLNNNDIINVLSITSATGTFTTLNATSIFLNGQGIVEFKWVGAWSGSSVNYAVKNGVSNNNSSYICKLAHTSSGTSEPGIGASWTTYWDLLALQGATGSTGATGTSGNNAGLYFQFSTTTSMADPGLGLLRYNNATPASVTAIAIDDTTSDSGNPDLSTYILSWDDSTTAAVKGSLIIREVGSPANIHVFNITGLTDNAGWTQLTVSWVAGSGIFSNTDNISVEFYRVGDKGTDGLGVGDVVGPAGAVADQFVKFDGATGKLIKAGATTIGASEIAADAVTTSKILDANVTTAKLAADAVTYAKMQNISATDRILGRSTAGAGDVEEIVFTAAARALADDADAAAQRATLGLGSAAVLPEMTAAEYLANTADKIASTDQVWAAAAEVALTDAATISVDMNAFINATVTLAGNRTLGSPTNEKVGQSGAIRIVQDATGSRTLSYGTDWEFAGGTAPILSTAANAQDVLFYHVLAANRVLGSLVKGVA